MYFFKKKNLIHLIVFSVFFIGYRYIFFEYYPSFTIQPDSASYFQEYKKMANGIEPDFLYRSPLYPIISFLIFLKFIQYYFISKYFNLYNVNHFLLLNF